MKTFLAIVGVVAAIVAAAFYFVFSLQSGLTSTQIHAEDQRLRQIGTDPQIIREAQRRALMTSATSARRHR